MNPQGTALCGSVLFSVAKNISFEKKHLDLDSGLPLSFTLDKLHYLLSVHVCSPIKVCLFMRFK